MLAGATKERRSAEDARAEKDLERGMEMLERIEASAGAKSAQEPKKPQVVFHRIPVEPSKLNERSGLLIAGSRAIRHSHLAHLHILRYLEWAQKVLGRAPLPLCDIEDPNQGYGFGLTGPASEPATANVASASASLSSPSSSASASMSAPPPPETAVAAAAEAAM